MVILFLLEMYDIERQSVLLIISLYQWLVQHPRWTVQNWKQRQPSESLKKKANQNLTLFL